MASKFRVQKNKDVVVGVSIRCISATSDGLFVVGGQNKDIEVYNSEGKQLKTFATGFDISSITAQPNSIFVSSPGVFATLGCQAKEYTSEGDVKKEMSFTGLNWTREGVVDGVYSQVLEDRGLYITSTPENTLYMVSLNTNALYSCDAPKKHFRFIRQLSWRSRPSHLCYGPNEKLYIYFRNNNEVLVYPNVKETVYHLNPKTKVIDMSCGGQKHIFVLTDDGMIRILDENCKEIPEEKLDLIKDHGIGKPNAIAVDKDGNLYVGHSGSTVTIFKCERRGSKDTDL